ncbi:hypothetical protein FB45DRAFT_756936 [Roridomyces roridus]|uniref:DUF6593 domain-containing protein n=1 Tax=Roridomyces roridus TaxID=1738132 RepID=A0AAD7FGA3_9AGAR|nr:hypothetical protein FB45DRAFT_767437 [Roridomyces roridus]KAJ7617038.1 hypothetical protein FB45DRAFT_756936 [Roridomyces roridus]
MNSQHPTHINPYSAWSNRAGSDIPSVYGALPFASNASTSHIVLFSFTDFSPSILNCNVVGRNTGLHFRITTDPSSMPGYTTITDQEGKRISLIEWKDRPLVEISDIFSKRRVADWLTLSRDASHRVMKVKGRKYVWTPRQKAICLYPTETSTPALLGQITREDDGTISLEIAASAVAEGLLETCIVATVLLQCGHTID